MADAGDALASPGVLLCAAADLGRCHGTYLVEMIELFATEGCEIAGPCRRWADDGSPAWYGKRTACR